LIFRTWFCHRLNRFFRSGLLWFLFFWNLCWWVGTVYLRRLWRLIIVVLNNNSYIRNNFLCITLTCIRGWVGSCNTWGLYALSLGAIHKLKHNFIEFNLIIAALRVLSFRITLLLRFELLLFVFGRLARICHLMLLYFSLNYLLKFLSLLQYQLFY
jgi:hypothetical protein